MQSIFVTLFFKRFIEVDIKPETTLNMIFTSIHEKSGLTRQQIAEKADVGLKILRRFLIDTNSIDKESAERIIAAYTFFCSELCAPYENEIKGGLALLRSRAPRDPKTVNFDLFILHHQSRLTQTLVAANAGIRLEHLNDILLGNKTPERETAQKVAAAYARLNEAEWEKHKNILQPKIAALKSGKKSAPKNTNSIYHDFYLLSETYEPSCVRTLSTYTGISISTLKRIHKGQISISKETARKIAAAYEKLAPELWEVHAEKINKKIKRLKPDRRKITYTISLILEQSGLSIQTLARAADIRPSTFSRIFQGTKELTQAEAEKLVFAFHSLCPEVWKKQKKSFLKKIGALARNRKTGKHFEPTLEKDTFGYALFACLKKDGIIFDLKKEANGMGLTSAKLSHIIRNIIKPTPQEMENLSKTLKDSNPRQWARCVALYESMPEKPTIGRKLREPQPDTVQHLVYRAITSQGTSAARIYLDANIDGGNFRAWYRGERTFHEHHIIRLIRSLKENCPKSWPEIRDEFYTFYPDLHHLETEPVSANNVIPFPVGHLAHASLPVSAGIEEWRAALGALVKKVREENQEGHENVAIFPIIQKAIPDIEHGAEVHPTILRMAIAEICSEYKLEERSPELFANMKAARDNIILLSGQYSAMSARPHAKLLRAP